MAKLLQKAVTPRIRTTILTAAPIPHRILIQKLQLIPIRPIKSLQTLSSIIKIRRLYEIKTNRNGKKTKTNHEKTGNDGKQNERFEKG